VTQSAGCKRQLGTSWASRVSTRKIEVGKQRLVMCALPPIAAALTPDRSGRFGPIASLRIAEKQQAFSPLDHRKFVTELHFVLSFVISQRVGSKQSTIARREFTIDRTSC
jgi:hypothetical protein